MPDDVLADSDNNVLEVHVTQDVRQRHKKKLSKSELRIRQRKDSWRRLRTETQKLESDTKSCQEIGLNTSIRLSLDRNYGVAATDCVRHGLAAKS